MNQIIDCYVDAWRNWNNFSGRTRRSGYWYTVLANIIVAVVFGILTSIAGIFGILSTLYSLAFLVPGLALTIRRLHDAGKSGWWLLIYLVPLVGWILLLVWLCTDSVPDNQWGPNPKGYGPQPYGPQNYGAQNYGPQTGYQYSQNDDNRKGPEL
jgi:uncharacterized membrane protein YhaH (DUF805 family)